MLALSMVATGFVPLQVWAARSEQEATPAPVERRPTGPQEFRININGEPDKIDPGNSSFADEIAVIHQVFRPLYYFDHNLNIVPSVAQSHDVSADGLTYTFKLRDDVKYSDGQKVVAKDIEYALQRHLDPKLATDYASFWYIIKNAEAYNSGDLTDWSQVGIKALDDTTLQLTLERPAGYIPALVTLWMTSPVRKELVEAGGEQWYNEPKYYIGNGPFVLKEWVHQSSLTFEPNPHYFGTKPALTKLQFIIQPDINADYAAYLNGEREMLPVVPDAQRQIVLQDPELSKQIIRMPLLTTTTLGFNVKQPPFDKVKVRQAFSLAVDREAYIREVNQGVGIPAYSWIPPGMPGHEPEMGLQWKFNPARAKELLAEAGYADPSSLPRIVFKYSATSQNQRRAEWFQAQFRQNLGVEMELEPMEAKAFQQAYKDGDYQFTFIGWGADYPDPQSWYETNFGCKGGNNKTYWCNPEFDRLVEMADTETDLVTRLQHYSQAQQILVDEAVAIFLSHGEGFALVKPYVKGLVPTGLDAIASLGGDYFYENVWLEH